MIVFNGVVDLYLTGTTEIAAFLSYRTMTSSSLTSSVPTLTLLVYSHLPTCELKGLLTLFETDNDISVPI